MKGSQEVVDFVADRLREQRKNNELNLAKICEEVNMSINLGEIISIIVNSEYPSWLAPSPEAHAH